MFNLHRVPSSALQRDSESQSPNLAVPGLVVAGSLCSEPPVGRPLKSRRKSNLRLPQAFQELLRRTPKPRAAPLPRPQVETGPPEPWYLRPHDWPSLGGSRATPWHHSRKRPEKSFARSRLSNQPLWLQL